MPNLKINKDFAIHLYSLFLQVANNYKLSPLTFIFFQELKEKQIQMLSVFSHRTFCYSNIIYDK